MCLDSYTREYGYICRTLVYFTPVFHIFVFVRIWRTIVGKMLSKQLVFVKKGTPYFIFIIYDKFEARGYTHTHTRYCQYDKPIPEYGTII